MASYEIESKGLCVICSDGSRRNMMFYNRTREALARVETPEEFEELKPKEVIELVNETMSKLYSAYIEYHRSYSSTRWIYSYSSHIYFNSKTDAMAFKLRWS